MPQKTGTPGMNKINYYYFDGYGRAEPGRIMLWKAKAPIEDCRIGFDVWPKIKEEAPFKGSSLPVVVMPDGKVMTQSKPIWRYFATRAGFYPTDPEQVLVHDWVIDMYYDIFNQLSEPALAIFGGKTEADVAEMIDKNINELVPNFITSILPHASKTGKFFLGDKPHFVDCVLVTLYTDFIDNPFREASTKWSALKTKFPKFEEYAKGVKMWASEYYKQREPRPV